MNDLLESFHKGWKPFFKGSYVDWINTFVTLPHTYAIPGKVNLYRSKYLVDVILSLQDHAIRQVNAMAAVQTGKSFLADCYKLALIGNSSGTMLCLAQNDEASDRLTETRLIPLFKRCKELEALIPKDRFAITKTDIYLPNWNMHFSAAKENAIQSITAKVVIMDECYLYKDGYINEAKKRTHALPHTSKVFCISTAGDSKGEWNTEFNKGVQYTWGWLCPHCNKEQIWSWSKKLDNGHYAGIVWDCNEKTKPNALWNYLEAGKTARLVCEHCEHTLNDNPQTRKYLNDTGRYICTNPNGNPTIKSFRWIALANMDISFASICMEFLQAKDLKKLTGSRTAEREFQEKQLAEPWVDQFESKMIQILLESYDTNAAYGDYKFMTVDVQNNGEKFVYGIRAWCKNGESRLIKFGSVHTWTELRQTQLDNKINDQCVLIDSGHIATTVYAKCLEYGHWGFLKGKKVWFSWIALKGWDADDFQHKDGSKRLYSEQSMGDPAMGKLASKGKQCPLYRWSNRSIKNLLAHLRDGKGAKWVANEVTEEYTKAMNSEMFVKEIDKKTNREKWRWVKKDNVSNDLWDVECMQIVAAAMVGCIQGLT